MLGHVAQNPHAAGPRSHPRVCGDSGFSGAPGSPHLALGLPQPQAVTDPGPPANATTWAGCVRAELRVVHSHMSGTAALSPSSFPSRVTETEEDGQTRPYTNPPAPAASVSAPQAHQPLPSGTEEKPDLSTYGRWGTSSSPLGPVPLAGLAFVPDQVAGQCEGATTV